MITIGVDISKDTLDVFFTYNGKKIRARYTNTSQGIQALLKFLPADAFVVFESTGAYTKLLYKVLCDNNVKCCCTNPLTVRRFAQGMGYLAKTDSIDGEVLNKAIKGTQEQHKLIREKTDDFMVRNPVYTEKARRLTTITGIGLTTAKCHIHIILIKF